MISSDFAGHEICMLHGWRHTCRRPLHMHHVVNKGKTQKSPAARKYCEKKHPEVLIVPMCCDANVSRLADSKEGQAVILHRLVEIWGLEYVRAVVDGIPWEIPHPEMRFDALVASMPADVVS